MIRTAKVIFCDNDHGTGDITFPSLDRSVAELEAEYISPQTIGQLRRNAKKAGWGRLNGADYCPGCIDAL